jgi:2-polyprenyl-6-methoxyphenol hydroxylase-like FAD-dependent oxidoreductase
MAPLIAKQAIVVGAGMGGLTTAAALAPHFERVLIVDADVLRDHAGERAGVPQGKHVHLLLAGGQQALSHLFSSFEHDLARAGAVPMRVGLDLRSDSPAFTPFPQRDLGFHAFGLSRPQLELTVRRRVQAVRNIELRQRSRAQALLPRDGGAGVSGVRYDDEHGQAQTAAGDLTRAGGPDGIRSSRRRGCAAVPDFVHPETRGERPRISRRRSSSASRSTGWRHAIQRCTG